MNSLQTSTIQEDHSLRDVRFHKTATNKRVSRFRFNPFSKKSLTEQTDGNEETVNMYCKATQYGSVAESEARQRQLLMFLAGNLPPLDLVIDSKTGIFLDSDEMCSQLTYLLQTSHRLDSGNFMMFWKKLRSQIVLCFAVPMKWFIDFVALVVCIAVVAILYRCREDIGTVVNIAVTAKAHLVAAFEVTMEWMGQATSSNLGILVGFTIGSTTASIKKKLNELRNYINDQPFIQALSHLTQYYVAQEFIRSSIAHHRLELNFGMTEEMQNTIHNNAQKIEKFVDLRCNRMTMDNLYDELSSTKRKWFGMGGDSQNDAIREFLFKTVFNANGRHISPFILDPGKNREYRQTLLRMSESRSFVGTNKDTSFTLFHFVNSHGGIRDISDIAKAFVILSDTASKVTISKVAVNDALKASISLRKKKHSKKHHIRQHHPHSYSAAAAAGGSRRRRSRRRRR